MIGSTPCHVGCIPAQHRLGAWLGNGLLPIVLSRRHLYSSYFPASRPDKVRTAFLIHAPGGCIAGGDCGKRHGWAVCQFPRAENPLWAHSINQNLSTLPRPKSVSCHVDLCYGQKDQLLFLWAGGCRVSCIHKLCHHATNTSAIQARHYQIQGSGYRSHAAAGAREIPRSCI